MKLIVIKSRRKLSSKNNPRTMFSPDQFNHQTFGVNNEKDLFIELRTYSCQPLKTE